MKRSKPLIKKRYLVITAIIAYVCLKIYVSSTPNTNDDAWPELVRDAILGWKA